MLAALSVAFAVPDGARAQSRPDTLVYSIAVVERDPHLSVEARLSAARGSVTLLSPPAAGPAGTRLAGLSATDDRGAPLRVTHRGAAWVIEVPTPGPVRFRYRLDLQRRTTEGSTGSGLDSTRFYAVTRSLFVALDPTAFRKTGDRYPVVRVRVLAPAGWRVFGGWAGADGDYRPDGGDDLLGATLAAAPDYRLYRGSAGSAAWQLAIRGERYFADSTLQALINASLSGAARALGPVPVPRVTYTADLGLKGRTSGSLQGTASIGLIWEPSEVLETPRGHDLFHETLHLWFGGAMEAERWWTEGVTDYLAARLYADFRRESGELAFLVFQSLRNYQLIEHRTRLTMAQETRNGVGGDNTELLVYRKGMLAGLLLDAAIRRASGGRRSLDDVARNLLATAGTRSSRRVRDAEIHAAVVAVGGREADQVWARVVDSSDLLTEVDVTTALGVVTGRRFDPPDMMLKDRKRLQGPN